MESRTCTRQSIDFLKANSSYLDPQKSARLWWMGIASGSIIPLIIIAMWQYLARVINVEFDRAERVIMTTCAVQFAFQIWYQFSRHGSTLEISYYWSTMVPVLLLAFCVVLGKLVAHRIGFCCLRHGVCAGRGACLAHGYARVLWILARRRSRPAAHRGGLAA